jgi:aspartokinase
MAPGMVLGIQAVVSEQEITRIRINGDNAISDFQWALDYLEKEQIPIKELHAETTDDINCHSGVSFVVSTQNVYGWKKIKQQLINRLGEHIRFDTHLSALSLIGEGLNRTNVVLLQTMSLLRQHKIDIAGITTTSFRISLLIPNGTIGDAVRLCHDQWIDT